MSSDTILSQNGDIDEQLHSRQLAVYGRETMRKLAGAHVLISGMRGLGQEIAKNVILTGVKRVTVHDAEAAAVEDMSAGFYLSETDAGTNRAQAVKPRLQELNPSCEVDAYTGPLTTQVIAQYQALVVTNTPVQECVELNKLCREQSPATSFIRCDNRGVFGAAFCDCGPEFTVTDPDGEQPKSGIVASITGSNPPLVTSVEDERFEFDDGEYVTFSEVEGIPTLNDGMPRRVKNCKGASFELDEDLTGKGEHVSGGRVTEVKMQRKFTFKPLHEALNSPAEFLMSDLGKFEMPAQLHVAFQGLDRFIMREARLPYPGNEEDADAVLHDAKKVNANSSPDAAVESLDEVTVKALARGAKGDITPMACLIGGVVGQEVIKACSNKLSPLKQFFYIDSLESLPEHLSEEERQPFGGSRYDNQIAVIGKTMQQKLHSLNTFLVGAGALGCEYIKNFATMGISTSGKGVMTDDDTVERSNLSRQFLFRDTDIGKAKSEVAARAAQGINRELRLETHQNRVSPETESVFDDDFWNSLDVVFNALDNVNARLYVDGRCVYFNKPLLESGTLGTKCNTQVVVPRLTENYGATRDPPEKEAPMCTVHSFPHNIHHCLTWARSEFEGLYEKGPGEATKFLADPEAYLKDAEQNADSQTREKLEELVDVLVDGKCTTYQDCIAWARHKFQDYFNNKIVQLTYTFPYDSFTSSGTPFWSPPKRFPYPVKFSAEDESHLRTVQALANVKADVYNIEKPVWKDDMKQFARAVEKVEVPEFKPKSGIKIETDPNADDSQQKSTGDDEQQVAELVEKLRSQSVQRMLVNPIKFEKDDDTNFHVDVVYSLANMRARNYQIEEVDRLQAKLIAGRIVPAIATSTALATGLTCLELYKLLLDKPIESYRNTFANLALPLFAMAEPVPPKTTKYGNLQWSLWDRWVIKGDITVRELLNWFKERGLEAYSITCGSALLYNSIFPKHKERLDRKLSELAQSVGKFELPTKRRHLDIVVACEGEDEEDVDVPLLSIEFR